MSQDAEIKTPAMFQSDNTSLEDGAAACSSGLEGTQDTDKEILAPARAGSSSNTFATEQTNTGGIIAFSQDGSTDASKYTSRKNDDRGGGQHFSSRTVTMAAKELPLGFLTPDTRKELHPNQLLKFDVCFHPAVAESNMSIERALSHGLALPASPITPENSVVQSPIGAQTHDEQHDTIPEDRCKTPVFCQDQSKAPRHPRNVTFSSRDEFFQLSPLSPKPGKTKKTESDVALHTNAWVKNRNDTTDSAEESNQDDGNTTSPVSCELKIKVSSEKPILPELNFKTSDDFSEVFAPVGGRGSHADFMATLGNNSLASKTFLNSDINDYEEGELGEDAFIEMSDFPNFIQRDLMLPGPIRDEYEEDHSTLPGSQTSPSDTALHGDKEEQYLPMPIGIWQCNDTQTSNLPHPKRKSRSQFLLPGASPFSEISSQSRPLSDPLRRQSFSFCPDDLTMQGQPVEACQTSSSNEASNINIEKVRQASFYLPKNLDLSKAEAVSQNVYNIPCPKPTIPDFPPPPLHDHCFRPLKGSTDSGSLLRENSLVGCSSSNTDMHDATHHLTTPSSSNPNLLHREKVARPKLAVTSTTTSLSSSPNSHHEVSLPGGSSFKAAKRKASPRVLQMPQKSPRRPKSSPDLRNPESSRTAQFESPPVVSLLNTNSQPPSRPFLETSRAYHFALQDFKKRNPLPLIVEGNEDLINEPSFDESADAKTAFVAPKTTYNRQSSDQPSQLSFSKLVDSSPQSFVNDQNKGHEDRETAISTNPSEPTVERRSRSSRTSSQIATGPTVEQSSGDHQNSLFSTDPSVKRYSRDRSEPNKVPYEIIEEIISRSHKDFTPAAGPTEKQVSGDQATTSLFHTAPTQSFISLQTYDKANESQRVASHLASPSEVVAIRDRDTSSKQSTNSLPKSIIYTPPRNKLVPEQHLSGDTQKGMCLLELTGDGYASDDSETRPSRPASQGIIAGQPRGVVSASASVPRSGPGVLSASTPLPTNQQLQVESHHSQPIPIPRQPEQPHESFSPEFGRHVGGVPETGDQDHVFPRNQYGTMAQGFYDTWVDPRGVALQSDSHDSSIDNGERRFGIPSEEDNQGSMAIADEDETMISTRDHHRLGQEAVPNEGFANDDEARIVSAYIQEGHHDDQYTTRYQVQNPMHYGSRILTVGEARSYALAQNQNDAQDQISVQVQDGEYSRVNEYQSETLQEGIRSISHHNVASEMPLANSPSYSIRGSLNGHHSDSSARSQLQISQYQRRDVSHGRVNLASQVSRDASEHADPLAATQEGNDTTMIVTNTAPSGDIFTGDPDISNMIYSASSRGPTEYVQNSPRYVSAVQHMREEYIGPPVAERSGLNVVDPFPSFTERGLSRSSSIRRAEYSPTLGGFTEGATERSARSARQAVATSNPQRSAMATNRVIEDENNRHSITSNFDVNSIVAASTPRSARYGPPRLPPPTSPLPPIPNQRLSRPAGPPPTSPLPPTPTRHDQLATISEPSTQTQDLELSPIVRQAITDTVNTVLQRALTEQALTQGAERSLQSAIGDTDCEAASSNADLSINVGSVRTDSTRLVASQAGGEANSRAPSTRAGSQTSQSPEIVSSGAFSAPATYQHHPFPAPTRILSGSAPGLMAAPIPWFNAEGIEHQGDVLRAKDAQAREERLKREKAREEKKLAKKASKLTLREETGESSRSGMVGTVMRALKKRTSSKTSNSDTGSAKSAKRPESPDPDPSTEGKGKATR